MTGDIFVVDEESDASSTDDDSDEDEDTLELYFNASDMSDSDD